MFFLSLCLCTNTHIDLMVFSTADFSIVKLWLPISRRFKPMLKFIHYTFLMCSFNILLRVHVNLFKITFFHQFFLKFQSYFPVVSIGNLKQICDFAMNFVYYEQQQINLLETFFTNCTKPTESTTK